MRPPGEAQVRGDDEAGAFIQFTDEMKQQGTPGLMQRQVSQFVQNDQAGMHQTLGQMSLPAVEFFLLRAVTSSMVERKRTR